MQFSSREEEEEGEARINHKLIEKMENKIDASCEERSNDNLEKQTDAATDAEDEADISVLR